MDHAVLTAVGEDRPGLVHAVSQLILRAGCNLEDSRMALLGGEFAMLILVSGSPDGIDRVLAEADAAGRAVGLSITGHRTRARAADGRPAIPYQIVAYAMDHPGIVERVTKLIAERGINIRSLETRIGFAPHSGQPLFSMHALVDVPSGENVASLRQALTQLGSEHDVDVTIEAAR